MPSLIKTFDLSLYPVVDGVLDDLVDSIAEWQRDGILTDQNIEGIRGLVETLYDETGYTFPQCDPDPFPDHAWYIQHKNPYSDRGVWVSITHIEPYFRAVEFRPPFRGEYRIATAVRLTPASRSAAGLEFGDPQTLDPAVVYRVTPTGFTPLEMPDAPVIVH